MENVRQSNESIVAEKPVVAEHKQFQMCFFRCFHTSSVYIYTVGKDAAVSTYIYVHIYQTVRRHITDNLNLIQTHCRISGQ